MSKDAEQDGQVWPEVTEKAVRRWFTAEYKERIVDEADRCTEPGQVGQLLRREGPLLIAMGWLNPASFSRLGGQQVAHEKRRRSWNVSGNL